MALAFLAVLLFTFFALVDAYRHEAWTAVCFSGAAMVGTLIAYGAFADPP